MHSPIDMDFNMEPEVLSSRVFLSKRTGSLAVGRPIVVCSLAKCPAIDMIICSNFSDFIGYWIVVEEDGMMMNKKFVEAEFEDLGEL